ncbi:unnamed protein product [Nezara viridula]|uniref:Uncharacterized protein n=1 Tax=Nezara viridula TaxID=85310 RepID=A0A9P0HCF6_NEZVI|nr:unnamed protein product [Nezara viridula]
MFNFLNSYALRLLCPVRKRKIRRYSQQHLWVREHDANNTEVPENVVQSSNATNTPTTINSIPNVPVSNRFEPLSTEMEDEPDETTVAHQPPPIKIKEHLPPEAEHDRLTLTRPYLAKTTQHDLRTGNVY